MQPEVVEALSDPAGNLDEPESEAIELHARDAQAHEPATERVQEPIGGRVEQESELVGEEAVIA